MGREQITVPESLSEAIDERFGDGTANTDAEAYRRALWFAVKHHDREFGPPEPSDSNEPSDK